MNFQQTSYQKLKFDISLTIPKIEQTQFQEKLAAATTKESKNQILLWGTGELTNLEYRIVFSRKSNPQQNQVPDSAFYFTTKEEVYLKLN